MLGGSIIPTYGEIRISNLELFENMQRCRQQMGFCPQFNALFDSLTAREHLQLFASIKGVDPKAIDQQVESKLKELGLTAYSDLATMGYSGGNKRKLSVALAMIGGPSIMLLDG